MFLILILVPCDSDRVLQKFIPQLYTVPETGVLHICSQITNASIGSLIMFLDKSKIFPCSFQYVSNSISILTITIQSISEKKSIILHMLCHWKTFPFLMHLNQFYIALASLNKSQTLFRGLPGNNTRELLSLTNYWALILAVRTGIDRR